MVAQLHHRQPLRLRLRLQRPRPRLQLVAARRRARPQGARRLIGASAQGLATLGQPFA